MLLPKEESRLEQEAALRYALNFCLCPEATAKDTGAAEDRGAQQSLISNRDANLLCRLRIKMAEMPKESG